MVNAIINKEIRMNLTELSIEVGISREHISFIKNGSRNVGKSLAVRLENATGISQTKWMWPERYGEPWGQLEKLKKFKD